MNFRLIVAAIVRNDKDQILLLKMHADHGVYPGQWGLVGGGVEEGESVKDALAREVMEETAIGVSEVEEFWFFDEERPKQFSDGTRKDIYMVYLLYDALALKEDIVVNEEWDEFAWVDVSELHTYDLNVATKKTFTKKGWL